MLENKPKFSIIKDCKIGKGTVIKDFTNIYKATIGKNSKIHAYVYIEEGVKIGNNVLLPLGSNTWQEQIVVAAKEVFPLPNADILQLSMIGINPPTAYSMITEYVQLEPGDWIVQNAANSAVDDLGRSSQTLSPWGRDY